MLDLPPMILFEVPSKEDTWDLTANKIPPDLPELGIWMKTNSGQILERGTERSRAILVSTRTTGQ